MESDHPRVRSIVAWPWKINALVNEKWNNVTAVRRNEATHLPAVNWAPGGITV